MGTTLGRYVGAFCAVAGSLVLASPARAVLYTFHNSINANNDFSVMAGGQTATFSSSSGPAAFTVNPSADIFSFSVALGGFGNFNGDPLTITFSEPVVGRILIPFGIFEAYATVPATLVATTDTGQSMVFTTAFYNLISGSPEGTVHFVPAGPIGSVTLTSSFAFAIAGVDVPEPSSAALLGGGLLMMAWRRRRQSLSRMGIAGRPTS